MGSLERNAKAVADEAKSFGTKYVVITGMYRFDYSDETTMHDLAARLNKTGAALKAEGVQTAVFSKKADAFCGKIIEHYFGPDSFSLVRGSRPGVPTKPDPAGVYSLMADLGADPQSTLFVGDSDVDILTGHNAGLPALGVLWGFRGEAELTAAGADALAAKPEDILTYLHQH